MLVFVSLQNLSLFLETTFTSVCFFFLFCLFFTQMRLPIFEHNMNPRAQRVFFSQAQKTTSGTTTRCHDQLGRPQDGLLAKTGLQDVFFLFSFQVMVNWWFGLVVWDSREVTHRFQKGMRGIQTTRPQTTNPNPPIYH